MRALASIGVSVALAVAGCQAVLGEDGPLPGDEEALDEGSTQHVAGADCDASSDCGQLLRCVEGHCRYVQTTLEGELLAAAARTQLEAGDARSAYETYVAALNAYDEAGVPIPPEVLCLSAEAALSCPADEVPRELAARRADACFRGSVPGDETRGRVLSKVASLRYEGLELSAFDREEIPSQFFTAPRSRPDPGTVEVDIRMPDEDGPGHAEVAEAIDTSAVRRAVADCLLESWERTHQREVAIELQLEFSSRLRDMGHYDIYEGRVDVDRERLPAQGFGACAAEALESAFGDPIRMQRIVSWEADVEVVARAR